MQISQQIARGGDFVVVFIVHSMLYDKCTLIIRKMSLTNVIYAYEIYKTKSEKKKKYIEMLKKTDVLKIEIEQKKPKQKKHVG